MQEHHSNGHPSPELMQEVADQALTLDEVQRTFPSFWAHLQECEECQEAFAALMQLAYDKGHVDGHAEESETRRAVVTTALAGVLAVVVLAVGFLFWQRMSEDAAVNRVYEAMSPAVANIQVNSTGLKGSGVVFDERGYVLTNFHVIEGAEGDEDIAVTLPGLGEVPSRLVGYDVPADLAVLRIDAPSDRLRVADFGDSDTVEVGDLAIAIGNPFGLAHSLTVGHISAVERRLMTSDPYAPDIAGVLQTDAAINPGNSGGPLFDTAGNVVGITTRIESPTRGSAGIGFAIPSETALRVAREIIQRGYVRRSFLGIAGRPVNQQIAQMLDLPVDYGLLIQDIHPESPAAKLDLQADGKTAGTATGMMKTDADVLLAIDGQPVNDQEELNRAVAQHDVGDRVELEVWQDGRRATLQVALAERPRMGME